MIGKRKNAEAAIQRELVRYLARTQFSFEIKVAASQNENSRHAVNQGMDKGEPDLRLAVRVDDTAHFFFLELKTLTGTLIPSQIEWNADFDENYASSNWSRDVAYGLVEAKEKINNWLLTLSDNRI